MNEAIFNAFASACNQAAWMVGLRFEGLTFDYLTYQWTVRIEGLEYLVVPVEVAGVPDLLNKLIAAYKKLPARQMKGVIKS